MGENPVKATATTFRVIAALDEAVLDRRPGDLAPADFAAIAATAAETDSTGSDPDTAVED